MSDGNAIEGLFWGCLLSLPFWAVVGWLIHRIVTSS